LHLIGQEYPEHEIGTHTFSYYYCKEVGQTLEDFRADLKAAIAIANARGIDIKSLVFPRNQYNRDYLDVCRELGIETYRGNEEVWFQDQTVRRVLRLIKELFAPLIVISIFQGIISSLEELSGPKPFNIPSSRLLRPYMDKGDNI